MEQHKESYQPVRKETAEADSGLTALRTDQEDRINGPRLLSAEALCIAFAVTEAGENASAADYFIAMELASSLANRGCRIRYLCRRGPKDWYNVGADVDMLISMLDDYDLNRMYHVREDLFTVAWAHNRFPRWTCNPSIQRYSLVLASSKTACDYMAKATGLTVSLFPIATNASRFRAVMNQPETPNEKAAYGSDYVFTGSYWDSPREIMNCMEPGALPYKLRIFGRNWEKVPEFAGYTGGFLEYEKMPLVYKYTKLVVDDANHGTAEFGSVNSRVFDALAAGRLVLTNGAKGAEETFRGMLPVFRSAREFKALTVFYMEHPADREALTKRLQKFVLENHTYDIRANTLLRLITDQRTVDIPPEKKIADQRPGGIPPEKKIADQRLCGIPPEKKIAIMTPVRKWSEAEAWGDYHFAVAMKKCFEEIGYRAEIRILPEWEKEFDGKYVIVLRGLSVYHPRKEHINLMWNISHPDEVTTEEYNQYDAVFVSSLIWAEHLKPLLKVPVYPLLQCTDPDVFNGSRYSDGDKRYELLFVGNSRPVLRQILKDLIPTPYDLAVYGNYWHNRIDERYIRGTVIPNHKLGREYHDAAILLNDHWKDMKEKGFISNRIFDGLAAGAFIITDDVAGLSDVLKNCVEVYHNREELAKKVSYYMEHPKKRAEIAARGMALVRTKHTFRARTDEMLRVMKLCGSKPPKG